MIGPLPPRCPDCGMTPCRCESPSIAGVAVAVGFLGIFALWVLASQVEPKPPPSRPIPVLEHR